MENCPVKSIVKNWLFADVNRSGAVSPIILAKESRTPVVIPTFAGLYDDFDRIIFMFTPT